MSLLFMMRKTGQYDKSSVAGEVVEAFVPFALPPANPQFEMDEIIKDLLIRAEQKLMQLELASQMVPSLDWFIYAYVRKEAVTSSQIEGTQATLMDLLSFEADDHLKKDNAPDIEEVCNYLDAIKYARVQLNDKKGLPLSMRLLNQTHKRLMKGARGGNKQPGEIRQSQNWIGGSRPGAAVFVPPPPMKLAKLLTDFEKYIHDDDKLPRLIRIGFLHVQFETIHPYLDGNGRIGRLLITLLLEYWGFLQSPLLYLSLYFKRNRDDYYRLLGNVRLQGDWESWTKFFLLGISEIADEAMRLASHLSQIVKEDRAKVLAENTTSIFAMRLFELLPTHPIITMPQVVKLLHTSKPTALKAIATLEKLKILRENTGRKRDRCFEYADYIGKLKFGTELKMYRIVVNYAFENFVIKKSNANYTEKANYELFYESEFDAEKFYAEVVSKLKKTASFRHADLDVYDSQFKRWANKKSSSLWSENISDIPTAYTSDVVKNNLDSLRDIIRKWK